MELAKWMIKDQDPGRWESRSSLTTTSTSRSRKARCFLPFLMEVNTSMKILEWAAKAVTRVESGLAAKTKLTH